MAVDGKWSKAFSRYLQGCCLHAMDDHAAAAEVFAMVPGLVRKAGLRGPPPIDAFALRRAAVSSALQPRCIGSLCVASNAFDDDIASRWVGHLPAADSSAWLEVDLEYEQPISHMRIDFEDASSDIYEISTSSDNITWTVINLGSDNEVDRLDRRQRHEEVDAAGSEKYRRNAGVLVQRHRVDTFDFPTINARFARFRHIASPISSSSSDSADSGGVSTVSIWEWSIFSGDIVVSDLSASVQPDGWRHYRGAQVFGNELATFPRESMDVVPLLLLLRTTQKGRSAPTKRSWMQWRRRVLT
jgi:hypothetical protein